MNPLSERITQYLGAGGLFNPEHMDHDKVRDLLIDIRDHLDGKTPVCVGPHKFYWELSNGEPWGEPMDLQSYDTKLIIGTCVKCQITHARILEIEEVRRTMENLAATVARISK